MADTKTKIDEVVPDLEVAAPSSAPAKKVELDLDDAPFLQADEKPEPPANIADDVSPAEDAAMLAARRRRKRIIIAAAAVLAVLVAVAVWWFFIRTPPPPPPDSPAPDVVVVPSTPAPTGPHDIVQAFSPFIVPTDNADGTANFLVCKFSAITTDPKVQQEMNQKMIPLRDAIYFYLRGKDSAFLLDARNGEAIKKDLVSVFNDYLSQGKLEDIVFESYLSN